MISFDKLLYSKTLSSQNKLFDLSCDALTESTKETSITNYLSVLIVEFTQFSILDKKVIKDKQCFDCFQSSALKLPTIHDKCLSLINTL